jgi:hypothetical protein
MSSTVTTTRGAMAACSPTLARGPVAVAFAMELLLRRVNSASTSRSIRYTRENESGESKQVFRGDGALSGKLGLANG